MLQTITLTLSMGNKLIVNILQLFKNFRDNKTAAQNPSHSIIQIIFTYKGEPVFALLFIFGALAPCAIVENIILHLNCVFVCKTLAFRIEAANAKRHLR